MPAHKPTSCCCFLTFYWHSSAAFCSQISSIIIRIIHVSHTKTELHRVAGHHVNKDSELDREPIQSFDVNSRTQYLIEPAWTSFPGQRQCGAESCQHPCRRHRGQEGRTFTQEIRWDTGCVPNHILFLLVCTTTALTKYILSHTVCLQLEHITSS